ncbi:maleylpyruvate isomerase N-terminal domain-containing protein [Labedaea rhizosphaerae]|uniref:MDMPI-like protein n=1 Tax=Labedaea rhizosphaerae TaxID=598644 RepID=A0A4R6SP93_LABRH|nr:maleylpyruvate isomerase N-terminal domain-containing protein [Labedaea rhizosphaerae]TDQ05410.1 MDMPI-like protein [Labedaea rhizosphaerae]
MTTAMWTIKGWSAVRTEQAAMLRTALDQPSLAIEVPSCPGWRLADLAQHVGRFAETVTGYLRTGSRLPLPPVPLPSGDPLAYFDERMAALADACDATPANNPVWTLSPAAPDLAWVWHRRVAHELNLRRWDAQAALHSLVPTEQDQAVDALDELLGTLLAARFDASPPEVGGTVLIACEDGPHWRVTLTPGRLPDVELAAPGEAADATLSGRPSSLLYQLWGRLPLPDDPLLRTLRMP